MKNKIATITASMLLAVFSMCFVFADETDTVSESSGQSSIEFDLFEVTGSQTDDGIYYDDIIIKYSLKAETGIKTVELLYSDKAIDQLDYTRDENGDEREELITEAEGEFTIAAEFLADREPDDYEYTFIIRVTDGEDNRLDKEITVKADASVPEVKIDGIEDEGIYGEDKDIEITADDKNISNGILNIVILKDGNEIENKQGISAKDGYSFTADEDGTYEITATVKDKGNHEAADTKQFIIDETKPAIADIVISGEQNEGSDWYCGDINISGNVQDHGSGLKTVTVTINDEKVETEAASGNVKEIKIDLSAEEVSSIASKDGKYEIKIVAEDLAENKNTLSESFYADSVKPSITISGVDQGACINQKPEITITSNDKYADQGTISVIVLQDGVEINTMNKNGSQASLTDFESDGEYEIRATSTDAAGNTSDEETISFIYDTASPSVDDIKISGMKREGSDWFYDTVTFEMKGSDILSGLKTVTISINEEEIINEEPEGGQEAVVSEVFDKKWFEDNESRTGEYEIKAVVEDRAGNRETVTKNFYADVTAPSISLSGITEGEFTNKTPAVTATVTDNYSNKNTIQYIVTVDNSPYQDKTYEGSEYSFKEFNRDGRYVITAIATDPAGNTSAQGILTFTKDTVAPVLSLSGAKEGSFTTGAKNISANIKERNFSNMTVTADIVRELDGQESNVGFPGIKPDSSNYTKSQSVNGTGTYTVTISATDKAGNKAKTKKLTFTIDNDAPVVEISGVGEINGYDSTVAPEISYEDSYYESRDVSFTRASGKAVDIKGIHFSESTNAKGGNIKYDNFERKAALDDIYTLTCSVTDKAGNETTETATFYVNRFGSVYELTAGAKRLNREYVRSVNQDIVIKERNVTGINEGQGVLTIDGLSENVNVAPTGSVKNGYTEYTYTYPSEIFAKEGIYRINVVSTDKAGNSNEFIRENKWQLCVDRTAPTITVGGVEEGGIYDTSRKEMNIIVKDSMSLDGYVVTCDGREVYRSEDSSTIEANNSVYVPAGLNQDIRITATDTAGNERTMAIENVTVSGSFFARLFANKPLFYGLCGAALALIGAGIFIIMKRKKSKAEE